VSFILVPGPAPVGDAQFLDLVVEAAGYDDQLGGRCLLHPEVVFQEGLWGSGIKLLL